MILSLDVALRPFFRPDGLPLVFAGFCVFLLFFTAPPAAVFFAVGRKGLS